MKQRSNLTHSFQKYTRLGTKTARIEPEFWALTFEPHSLHLCLLASDLVSLDGSSGLTYRLGPGARRADTDVVSVKFKTRRNSGMLLHAQGEGGPGLSLELHRGRLQLLLTQGEPF